MGDKQPRQEYDGKQRPGFVYPAGQTGKVDKLSMWPTEQAQRFIESAVDARQFRHQTSRKHKQRRTESSPAETQSIKVSCQYQPGGEPDYRCRCHPVDHLWCFQHKRGHCHLDDKTCREKHDDIEHRGPLGMHQQRDEQYEPTNVECDA